MNQQPASGAQAEPMVAPLPADPHGLPPAVFEGATVVDQTAGVAPVPVEMVTPVTAPPPPLTPSPYAQPTAELPPVAAPVAPVAPPVPPQESGVAIPVRVDPPAAPIAEPMAEVPVPAPVALPVEPRIEEAAPKPEPPKVEAPAPKPVMPITEAPPREVEPPVAKAEEQHAKASTDHDAPPPVTQEPVVVVAGRDTQSENVSFNPDIKEIEESLHPAFLAENALGRNIEVSS